MSLADRAVITAALSGAVTMKSHNPNVPYTPDEFAEEAYRCYESGAAIVHIHPRDPDTGAPTPKVERVQDIIAAIRVRCPILINLSTAITPHVSNEERLNVIRHVQPDMASLNTNTMNTALVNWKTGETLDEVIFRNTFAMMKSFALTMRERHIKPELECYDLGGMYNTFFLRRQGLFEEPLHYSFVFNLAGGTWYSLDVLTTFVRTIPPDSTWQAIGVAAFQFPAAMTAVANGGHIRVGLEDNIHISKGMLASGSWEQVKKAVQIVRLVDREPATVEEAREIYHLR